MPGRFGRDCMPTQSRTKEAAPWRLSEAGPWRGSGRHMHDEGGSEIHSSQMLPVRLEEAGKLDGKWTRV
ncbi:hypothetical protein E5D57_008945 [Metarhizium anisopliae]|nr:hypothetical protein E5D57_008945 [Metarhizium anisopliae]